MQIEINKKIYTIPVGLSEITLRQRIAFEEIYGQELKDNAEWIKEMDPGTDQELEIMLNHADVAIKTLSHYANIPLEIVVKTNLTKVLQIFEACFSQLFQEINKVELQREHLFMDEMWVLEAPELTYKTDTTFNEFIVSKQILKQISEVGKGLWAGVPYLAAVYLRKEGEEFNEELLADGSERIELMHDLPMDTANQVAFFLSNSITTFLKTFQYLETAE